MSPWIPAAFFVAAAALTIVGLLWAVLTGKDGIALAGLVAVLIVLAAPVFLGMLA